MEIAHLILAHQDPIHVGRLARRLSRFSDVYIHIDASADLSPFLEQAGANERIHFLSDRIRCRWGGWNSVAAEMALLKAAAATGYDRYVLLQGADYPLKRDRYILDFFESNPDTEFIRGCCCTDSRDAYFRNRCYQYWFYNNPFLKRVWSRLKFLSKREFRTGYAVGDGAKHKVYWGSAQWAVTGVLAQYFIAFYDGHPHYNHWYYHAFPADELYYTTVAMNSPYGDRLYAKGPEPEQGGLVNWRNLHYFQYMPGYIKIFSKEDASLLEGLPELYLRKVTTEQSSQLLDWLDGQNQEE
jgi:hypothetical protein